MVSSHRTGQKVSDVYLELLQGSHRQRPYCSYLSFPFSTGLASKRNAALSLVIKMVVHSNEVIRMRGQPRAWAVSRLYDTSDDIE